jgi:hypothetical protein
MKNISLCDDEILSDMKYYSKTSLMFSSVIACFTFKSCKTKIFFKNCKY